MLTARCCPVKMRFAIRLRTQKQFGRNILDFTSRPAAAGIAYRGGQLRLRPRGRTGRSTREGLFIPWSFFFTVHGPTFNRRSTMDHGWGWRGVPPTTFVWHPAPNGPTKRTQLYFTADYGDQQFLCSLNDCLVSAFQTTAIWKEITTLDSLLTVIPNIETQFVDYSNNLNLDTFGISWD